MDFLEVELKCSFQFVHFIGFVFTYICHMSVIVFLSLTISISEHNELSRIESASAFKQNIS